MMSLASISPVHNKHTLPQMFLSLISSSINYPPQFNQIIMHVAAASLFWQLYERKLKKNMRSQIFLLRKREK